MYECVNRWIEVCDLEEEKKKGACMRYLARPIILKYGQILLDSLSYGIKSLLIIINKISPRNFLYHNNTRIRLHLT